MGQDKATRLKLHARLVAILGSTNVYFQPPPNIQMKYPCIVYHREAEHTDYADNFPTRRVKRWRITVIDSNPDSSIPSRVGDLPLCRYSRFYTSEHLNHDVFTLYF